MFKQETLRAKEMHHIYDLGFFRVKLHQNLSLKHL